MNLIVLLGQTCSGKSQMSVDLASLLGNSWIVNCDSRQVYKNLNIGTAKVEGKWQDFMTLGSVFLYENIPHFLFDFVEPDKIYTLSDYLVDWRKLFIGYKGLLPENIILTGGTGLFAKAAMEEYDLDEIKTDFIQSFNNLRHQLNNLNLAQLQVRLGIDKRSGFNTSDWNNPRRLINRILDQESRQKSWLAKSSLPYPKFDKIYSFAIWTDQNELKQKIQTRLAQRISQGLLQETMSIDYLGTKRLLSLGLEYRLTQLFLLGLIDYQTWQKELLQENIQYAKRQMTWLKKQNLVWIESVHDILAKIKI